MLPPIAQVGAPFLNASSGRAPASVRSVTGEDEVQRGIAAQALAQRGLLRNVAESEADAQSVPAQRSLGGIGAGLGDARLGYRHPCTFEVYTWEFVAGSPDGVVYSNRAVNNGHSAVWGSWPYAPPGTFGLLTTFVDASCALALAVFNTAGWPWSLGAGPPTALGGVGFEASSPTMSVDPASGFMHMAWLERPRGAFLYGYDLVIVLESEPMGSGIVSHLPRWLSRTAGIALLRSVAWMSGEEASLKYLAFDRGDGVSHYGCTFYDDGLPEDVADNLAVILDGPTWSSERSAAADRSSDPSVATSPDGLTVMTAWEERTLDAGGERRRACG